MRTDQEIVDQADQLARRMAEDVMGYRFTADVGPMRLQVDPRLRMCWRMAVLAIDALQCTDVEEALREVEATDG